MIEILDQAIARAAEKREPTHHLVLDEWSSYGAFGAELVIVTRGQADARLQRVGRLPGDDVDRAADRVATVERPLRTPQDLDPLHVQKIHGRHRGACDIDAVEVNGGAGIGTSDRGVRANPADGHQWGSCGTL